MALFERPFFATQWHEGLMLGAQHFQQSDLYQHRMLQHHTQALGMFHWGVFRLGIDQARLAEGVLSVLGCQAFMPDGTIIHHRHEVDGELALNFRDKTDDMRRAPLRVHLALAPWCDNAAFQDSATLPRYRSVTHPGVVDLNTGDNPLDIPVLVPRCTLVAENSIQAPAVSFPLAEITIRDDVCVLTSFCPPSVVTPLDSPLGHLCLDILGFLKEKMLRLNGQLQSPSLLDPVAARLRAQAMALIPGILPFEGILYTHRAHPFSLYTALLNLLGHLMALNPAQTIPETPRYDHHNLAVCFHQIFALLRQATEDLGQGTTLLAFDDDDKGFCLRLPRGVLQAGHPLVLALRPGPHVTGQEAVQWMETAIIATRPEVAKARDRRVLGANRRLLHSAGEDKAPPLPAGHQGFVLDPDPLFVHEHQELCVLNPSAAHKPAGLALLLPDESP